MDKEIKLVHDEPRGIQNLKEDKYLKAEKRTNLKRKINNN
jgi:hypothetical protein